jgi:hypothetical protein
VKLPPTTGMESIKYMNQDSQRRLNRIIQVLYLTFAVLLLPFLRFYLDCNDTLQYISIANKYAGGSVQDALNAYWSPLLSWLLVPFIKAGMEGFFVLKYLQLLLGFAALSCTLRLLDRFPALPWIGICFRFAFIPLFLNFALFNGTPDLLLLCWILVLALLFTANENKTASPAGSFSLLCALCGAFLYFSKTSGLIIFLLLYLFYHLYLLIVRKQKLTGVVLSWLKGCAVFLFIISPWVLALSKKYGTFTWSSSGTYNFGIIGPAVNPDIYGELHHPFYLGKLYDLPSAGALNAWEDPGIAHVPSWSPLHSAAEGKHYFRVIWKNLRSLQSCNFGKDTGTLFLLGWILLFFYQRKESYRLLRDQMLLLLIAATLSLFYIFIVIMHRYIWINDVVILLLAADLAGRLANPNKLGAYAFSLAFLLLISSQFIQEFRIHRDDGKANWEAAADFRSYAAPGRAASLEGDMEYSYDYSSLICYRSGSKYLGLVNSSLEPELGSYLKKFNVNYIFTWGHAPDPVLLTRGRAKLVKQYPEAQLSIYSFQ